MYDPVGIPIEKINEKEGAISFTATKSNLFDKDIPLIKMLEIHKNQTMFILQRDNALNLKFIQSNPNYATKIAKVNIEDFSSTSKLFISFTWSEKGKNMIYIRDYEHGLRSSESYEAPNIKFRVGKDGAIYQIGDEGVKVAACKVVIGEQTVLEPTAKELFDFQLEKIKVIIENCKKGNFLFETTLSQRVIVMLITAFEAYARERFIELEKEGKSVNIEELYHCFIPNRHREQFKDKIKEAAFKDGMTELEALISKRSINFQEWESFKDAYNKGYGLKIGEIGISNDLLIDIQRTFKWRHKIIHSKDDQTIINKEDFPSKEPIFTNKDWAVKNLYTFQKFINALHQSTLKL